MCDRLGRFCARNLDHPFGNDGTRDARPEKVLSLVNRVSLKHREDKIAGEFLAQIFNHAFGRACTQRFIL